MRHTPGPWIADGVTVRTIGKEAIVIATAEDYKKRIDELAANAALIASSPDLIAAISNIVDILDLPEQTPLLLPYIRDARYAIAKAEGKQYQIERGEA